MLNSGIEAVCMWFVQGTAKAEAVSRLLLNTSLYLSMVLEGYLQVFSTRLQQQLRFWADVFSAQVCSEA